MSSHRSTPTCAINRVNESGLVLFGILPFDYTFVWWRWVRSLPYLYTSVWAPSAFGSAFSLWPQRPGQGWTAPSCRDRQAARKREVKNNQRIKKDRRWRERRSESTKWRHEGTDREKWESGDVRQTKTKGVKTDGEGKGQSTDEEGKNLRWSRRNRLKIEKRGKVWRLGRDKQHRRKKMRVRHLVSPKAILQKDSAGVSLYRWGAVKNREKDRRQKTRQRGGNRESSQPAQLHQPKTPSDASRDRSCAPRPAQPPRSLLALTLPPPIPPPPLTSRGSIIITFTIPRPSGCCSPTAVQIVWSQWINLDTDFWSFFWPRS